MADAAPHGPAAPHTGLRAALKKELQLLELVLFKHNNQHRRTLYFRSFKSCCKAVRRLLLATRNVCVCGGGAACSLVRGELRACRAPALARSARAAPQRSGTLSISRSLSPSVLSPHDWCPVPATLAASSPRVMTPM
jgi:hypothetical protein